MGESLGHILPHSAKDGAVLGNMHDILSSFTRATFLLTMDLFPG